MASIKPCLLLRKPCSHVFLQLHSVCILDEPLRSDQAQELYLHSSNPPLTLTGSFSSRQLNDDIHAAVSRSKCCCSNQIPTARFFWSNQTPPSHNQLVFLLWDQGQTSFVFSFGSSMFNCLFTTLMSSCKSFTRLRRSCNLILHRLP